MVNSHANTVVFSLIARTPMIHVIPSRGNKIMVLFREDLKKRELILYECELSLHEVEFKGAPVLYTQMNCLPQGNHSTACTEHLYISSQNNEDMKGVLLLLL